MAPPALVAVVVGALLTLIVVVAVTTVVVQRVRRAYDEASTALRRLVPAIEQVQETTAVTQRELDRLGRSVDALHAARDARRAR